MFDFGLRAGRSILLSNDRKRGAGVAADGRAMLQAPRHDLAAHQKGEIKQAENWIYWI